MTKSITRNKKGHFIIICLIYQEDITILNLYVPNTHRLKIDKAKIQTELQGDRDKSIIIVEDKNISNVRTSS